MHRALAIVLLAPASFCGLLALGVSMLAVVWVYGDFAEGRISTGEFAWQAAALATPVAGPAVGWLLFAMRRYRTAAVAASLPLALSVLVLVKSLG